MSVKVTTRATTSLVRLAASALLLAGLLPPLTTVVHAQAGQPLPTPARLFEQGLAAYDAKDFTRAATLFQTACEKGIANACMNLAVQYMTGSGVTADPPRGLAMFERGCTLGNADSCANAAIARRQIAAAVARSRPAAPTTTVAQAAEACRNGSQEDCIRAGNAYLLGKEGVPKDPALALPLLSKACEGGEMVSCANVGVAYETGDKRTLSLDSSPVISTRIRRNGSNPHNPRIALATPAPPAFDRQHSAACHNRLLPLKILHLPAPQPLARHVSVTNRAR
jgi:TPR repeat protein